MANISSFFGSMDLDTDKDPWTPEGFILLYELLLTVDASAGGYGVAFDDRVMEDSASFLMELIDQQTKARTMEHPNPPSLTYWGNGRWSATGTFDHFNSWTMRNHKYDIDTAKHKNYVAQRTRLLELMCKHKWFLRFDYVDEEAGIGFIEMGKAYISAKKLDTPETSYTKDTYDYALVTETEEEASWEHNLKNFCEVIEEDRRSETFETRTRTLAELLQIPPVLLEIFQEWIIEYEWDAQLGAWDYYESTEDLPIGLEKAWRKNYAKISGII